MWLSLFAIIVVVRVTPIDATCSGGQWYPNSTTARDGYGVTIQSDVSGQGITVNAAGFVSMVNVPAGTASFFDILPGSVDGTYTLFNTQYGRYLQQDIGPPAAGVSNYYSYASAYIVTSTTVYSAAALWRIVSYFGAGFNPDGTPKYVYLVSNLYAGTMLGSVGVNAADNLLTTLVPQDLNSQLRLIVSGCTCNSVCVAGAPCVLGVCASSSSTGTVIQSSTGVNHILSSSSASSPPPSSTGTVIQSSTGVNHILSSSAEDLLSSSSSSHSSSSSVGESSSSADSISPSSSAEDIPSSSSSYPSSSTGESYIISSSADEVILSSSALSSSSSITESSSSSGVEGESSSSTGSSSTGDDFHNSTGNSTTCPEWTGGDYCCELGETFADPLFPCPNNGTCAIGGVCQCMFGYAGAWCCPAVLDIPCSGNGCCMGSGVCECYDRYSGIDCANRLGDHLTTEYKTNAMIIAAAIVVAVAIGIGVTLALPVLFPTSFLVVVEGRARQPSDYL